MKHIFSRNFILGLLIKFLIYAVYYLITTTIVTHLTGLSIDSGACGLISGSIFVVMTVVRPFSGFLSDRVNPKKLLLLTALLSIVATLGIAFSTSFNAILCFASLYGLGLCLLTNANDTLMIANISKDKMGAAISYVGLIPAVCSALFPWVGIKIIDFFSSAVVFKLSAVLSALIIVPVLMISVDWSACKEHNKIVVGNFINFRVLPYALMAGAFAVSTGLVNAFFLSTANINGLDNPGVFFAVAAIVMIPLKLVTGWLIDQSRIKLVVLASFLLTALALILIPNISSGVLLVVSAILFAFAQGSGQPSMQVLCCRSVPLSQRGVAISTFFLGVSVGLAIGNILGGLLIQICNYATAYYFSAALLAVALCVFLYRLKSTEY